MTTTDHVIHIFTDNPLSLSAVSPTRTTPLMSRSMDSTDTKRTVKPSVPLRKPRPISAGSPYGVKVKVEDRVDSREGRSSRTSTKQNKTSGVDQTQPRYLLPTI